MFLQTAGAPRLPTTCASCIASRSALWKNQLLGHQRSGRPSARCRGTPGVQRSSRRAGRRRRSTNPAAAPATDTGRERASSLRETFPLWASCAEEESLRSDPRSSIRGHRVARKSSLLDDSQHERPAEVNGRPAIGHAPRPQRRLATHHAPIMTRADAVSSAKGLWWRVVPHHSSHLRRVDVRAVAEDRQEQGSNTGVSSSQ
jgi:hypothetical protein